MSTDDSAPPPDAAPPPDPPPDAAAAAPADAATSAESSAAAKARAAAKLVRRRIPGRLRIPDRRRIPGRLRIPDPRRIPDRLRIPDPRRIPRRLRIPDRRRIRAEVIAQRRLVALGLVGVFIIGLAFLFALVVFAPDESLRAKLPPPNIAAVVSPNAPAIKISPRRSRDYVPAPAAVSAAAHLPLDIKVAQLFMVAVEGRSAAAGRAAGRAGWGGFVFDRSNFSNPRQVARLAAATKGAARRAGLIWPLLAARQEGGPDTAFPGLPPQGEASLGIHGNAPSVGEQALLAGERLRALGFSMTLAPLADVDTPGGGLTGRLFSTDPDFVTAFTAAAVAGYNHAHIISAPGHFPGAGAASSDPDQMSATVGGTMADLRNHDLNPFYAIAGSAPVILMSNAAYVAFDGVTPASLLPDAVKLLRTQLRFQGVVMSDDLDATLQPTAEGPGTVAVQALRAGDDLLYMSGSRAEEQAAYSAVLNAARHSASDRRLVEDALLRDLSLKARYGLLTRR